MKLSKLGSNMSLICGMLNLAFLWFFRWRYIIGNDKLEIQDKSLFIQSNINHLLSVLRKAYGIIQQ